MFKDGRENGHDEKLGGRPNIVTEALVAQIDDKIRENYRLTITELSFEFPQILRPA